MREGRKSRWNLLGADRADETATAASSPSIIRRAADQGRAAGIWWRDAYYRRLLCERPGATSGDWLQYGHALKELGRLGDAGQAYDKASSLQPDDPEIMLQIGYLFKIRGLFDQAYEAVERAGELGYPDRDLLDRETRMIRTARGGSRCRAAARGAPVAIRVYLSCPIRLFDEDDASGLGGLGGKDYSYALAMRLFATAFEEAGVDHAVIEHPERIPDAADLAPADVIVHIGFYPPEQMRLLKGAYNVICFAWEFARLRSQAESASHHAFADQATMLNLADELWIPSSEGTEVVAAVSCPVFHVPAPLRTRASAVVRSGLPDWTRLDRTLVALDRISWEPLAILPRLQATMNAMAASRRSTLRGLLLDADETLPPAIFLTVLNVHDFRKQLRPMIEGFLQLLIEKPYTILLVKLTTPDRGKLTVNEFIAMDQISDEGQLIPPMVSDRIWITDQYLTRREMDHLYDAATFYLCTSSAEGQNFPLLEAMSAGVVPVSTDVTAMRDYIDPENAVIVRSIEGPADHRMAQRYRIFDFSIARVEAQDVTAALNIACLLGPEEYAAKSARARTAVTRGFGPESALAALARIGDGENAAASQRDYR